MSIMKIRTMGDPVLREKSRKIENIDKSIKKLVKNMVDAVTKGDVEGVGLAAPQIGVPKRVFIVNFGDKIQSFINPEIKVLDDELIDGEEGCLSLYSIKYNVKRAKKIRLAAEDINGDKINIEAEGLLARIFQHEIDHLNGVLFIDHLDKEKRVELLTKISEIGKTEPL